MKKFAISRLLGAAALTICGLSSEPAHAGQVASCTVQYVQVLNEQLVLRCVNNANEYSAWGSGWTACNSRVSADTFKSFVSIAQAALLSGKPLLFNFNDTDNTCQTPARAVTLMRISQ